MSFKAEQFRRHAVPEFERFNAPRTIDANTTGLCELGCSFCWGPEKSYASLLNTNSWQRIFTEFMLRGTIAVVHTGGEPFMRSDSVRLIRFTKEVLGLHTTVSTNGMMHKKLVQALPYLDEVGIPLDGSDPILNGQMRTLNLPVKKPALRHFDLALTAMKLVKSCQPDVELTVRTVVSRVNFEDVETIGELLRWHNSQGIFPVDRWKLYHFTPTGGYGKYSNEEHGISAEVYNEIAEGMKNKFPELNVDTLTHSSRKGRYFFIMPDGDASGVNGDGSDYVRYGNVIENGVDQVLMEAAVRAVMKKAQINYLEQIA